MPGPIKFENGTRRPVWQPRLKNGQRLYRVVDGSSFNYRIWLDLNKGGRIGGSWVLELVLYRSRRRAERVARREQRRREKEQYREWKKAEQAGVNDD